MQRSKNWGLQGASVAVRARHEEVSKYYTRVHEPIEKKSEIDLPTPRNDR